MRDRNRSLRVEVWVILDLDLNVKAILPSATGDEYVRREMKAVLEMRMITTSMCRIARRIDALAEIAVPSLGLVI